MLTFWRIFISDWKLYYRVCLWRRLPGRRPMQRDGILRARPRRVPSMCWPAEGNDSCSVSECSNLCDLWQLAEDRRKLGISSLVFVHTEFGSTVISTIFCLNWYMRLGVYLGLRFPSGVIRNFYLYSMILRVDASCIYLPTWHAIKFTRQPGNTDMAFSIILCHQPAINYMPMPAHVL